MLSNCTYLAPCTLEEALFILRNQEPVPRILAGGTDILVRLQKNQEEVETLLDIKNIPELQELKLEEGLYIGAGVAVNSLLETEGIEEKYPLLIEGAKTLGSYPIRNRATVVGNVCNASPAADLAPPLLVLGCMVHCASQDGERRIPLEDFFTGPSSTVLGPHEMVRGLEVAPPPQRSASCYMKKSRIKGPDLSCVGLAALLSRDKGVLKMALGAVAPTPILLHLEEYIPRLEKDCTRASKEIVEIVLGQLQPISDLRGSKEFRLRIAATYVERALTRLWEEEQS